jgi:GSH-dependent disulfide-bond oxidoreductase
MSDTSEYIPPKVWTWNKPNGGRFANINRPIAGPTHQKELPVGRHPLQLYSLGTPNTQRREGRHHARGVARAGT